MNFKTVHGLGRQEFARKALDVALNSGLPPHHIDSWLKWFDGQPSDDVPAPAAPESCAGIKCDDNCVDCLPFGVPPPSDDPEPEYHAADLEEVAHKTINLIHGLAVEVMRKMYPNATDIGGDLKEVLDTARARVSAPGVVLGYVEEL